MTQTDSGIWFFFASADDTYPVIVITVVESPDSFSYSTQEVWRDTVGVPLILPISVFDIDNDGFPEILDNNGNGQPHYFWIFESIGNNQYDTVYTANPDPTLTDFPSSTHACGDFDNDGKIEFVMGGLSAGLLGATYWVYESPANNTYEQIIQGYVPTKNIRDCFTVPDADCDGKMEFIIKGFNTQTNAFIFEAIGDNTYEIVKTFNLSYGGDYFGGYSEASDVDGDSIPEIVLESNDYVYIIKSANNDSFYLWDTLPGNPGGSSVRVFDIDGNGLSEIIISGGNQTRIYEKTPFVTWFCPEPYDTFYANDTVYPRWRLDETIALDSLRLYWAHPLFGCHLIYQGLPTDTICQWVVPDTQSNMSNRFWLVTKGFGRYDSTYSPVFYIKRAPGIEEFANPHSAFRIPHLEVYPNPFHKNLTIKFQIPKQKGASSQKSVASIKIYDISGRLVRQWDYQTIRQSDQIIWSGDNNFGQRVSNGVYFIHLETGNRILLKEKVIKLE